MLRADDADELEKRLLQDLEALASIPQVPDALAGRLGQRIRLLAGTARCAEGELASAVRRCRRLRQQVRDLEEDRCQRAFMPPAAN